MACGVVCLSCYYALQPGFAIGCMHGPSVILCCVCCFVCVVFVCCVLFSLSLCFCFFVFSFLFVLAHAYALV